MSSSGIVKAVDIFEQSGCYILSGLPFVAPDKLSLEGFKESFNAVRGVVCHQRVWNI